MYVMVLALLINLCLNVTVWTLTPKIMCSFLAELKLKMLRSNVFYLQLPLYRFALFELFKIYFLYLSAIDVRHTPHNCLHLTCCRALELLHRM